MHVVTVCTTQTAVYRATDVNIAVRSIRYLTYLVKTGWSLEAFKKVHGRVPTQNFNHDNNNNNKISKSVETSQGGKVTILWNQQLQTDRTIPNNKPDIKIRDNEKGTCVLIDVAISGDRNVIKKKKPRKF